MRKGAEKGMLPSMHENARRRQDGETTKYGVLQVYQGRARFKRRVLNAIPALYMHDVDASRSTT